MYDVVKIIIVTLLLTKLISFRSFPEHFDEKIMFSENNRETRKLKVNIIFYNVIKCSIKYVLCMCVLPIYIIKQKTGS